MEGAFYRARTENEWDKPNKRREERERECKERTKERERMREREWIFGKQKYTALSGGYL